MKRAYLIAYTILRPIVAVFYPMRSRGRENVPEGPAIVCANHSNSVDALLVAFACGRKHYLHFMAKAELLKGFAVGRFLRAVGSFGVERGRTDVNAIRTAMRYLKSGEKVMIFPEGTRVDEDDAQAAKTGAIRLAARLNVPIVPVYLPRRKKLFGLVRVVIGRPYRVEESEHCDYGALSKQLMEKISELRPSGI